MIELCLWFLKVLINYNESNDIILFGYCKYIYIYNIYGKFKFLNLIC